MSSIPDRIIAREPLPSGTVTFVFTDIEGSTQRWERNRAAMREAVRKHDALMRSAMGAHDGHIFKTVGDAFCAAFSRPQDAIGAIIDVQRALASEDFSAIDGLRVRVALHTGTADERDGDYFGPSVNRVARLLAIGHGGQVLVSGTTMDLVQGTLPPQVSLRDLGEHQLKDLARPEHVYQLLAPDLAHDFAPLRSLATLPNNLPRMLTSFIGREEEIAEITALLERHQLVTLVGSGGIGKTRTSLHVAANLLDGSGDGVWFIELAPLTAGDYIPTTVAQALGITLPAEGDSLDNLVRALSVKHVLLVFDNCEHLIEAAARVISALLRGCPKIKILASSRQGLGIAGEAPYRMPSLGLPGETNDGAFRAADAARYPATALFVERARVADQRFAPSADNAATILDICRRLDGIPLAIELAAARVKILSPRQLRDRLHERFRVLTGGSRDVLPRQQTLRALIDWSHDLLDDRERALFRRLGIFVNGFTLEGAVAVGSGEDLADFDVFDVLASLVDKSLVLAEPTGEALRYRLLESTRVYARDKLEAAGEREGCAERHLLYLRDCFAALEERLERTGRQSDLEGAFATELEDIRAALEFALRSDSVPRGAELLAATRPHAWGALGLEHEGMVRAESYLGALSEPEPLLRARLWSAVSLIAGNLGRTTRAMEAATHAVTCARSPGGASTLGEALGEYVFAAAQSHRFDAAEAALAQAEAITDVSVEGRLRLLAARATLSALQGDPEAAARAQERVLQEYRSIGDAASVGVATLNLAEWTHAAGSTHRAIGLVREVLPASRAGSDRRMFINLMANLAAYLIAGEELVEARAVVREMICDLAPREPTSTFIAISFEPLALAFALGGDLARAAALEGYADAALRSQGFERELTETITHDRLVTLLEERLSADDLARGLAEGAALQPEAAIALALEET